MRVVLLIDEVLYDHDDPHFIKRKPQKHFEAEYYVSQALRTLGHEVSSVAARPDIAATLTDIKAARPDLVFNLVEVINENRRYDGLFVQIAELMNIPYTGATPETLALARNKHLAKLVVADAGVDVPRGIILSRGSTLPENGLRFPAIVKPLYLDGSDGITSRAYVNSLAALRQRVLQLLRESPEPLLCEEYIPGREIIVTISGIKDVTVDSICELAFPQTSRIKFATARAKFDEKYRRSVGIRYRTPTQLEAPTEKRVIDAARAAYNALRINAYAKIEFRVSDERVVFIEANPNSQMSRMAKSTDFASIGYEKFVDKIVQMALAR